MCSLRLYPSLPPPSRLLISYEQPCLCHLVNQGMHSITCLAPDPEDPTFHLTMAGKLLLHRPSHLHFTSSCLWHTIVADVK